MCKKGRLNLVKHGSRFLESTYKYASDIENTKFMVHLPNMSIEETKSFLNAIDEEWKKENPSFFEFAILLDGKHIGAVSVYLNDERNIGELGWILDKDYWGYGYAYEAAMLLVSFCREHLNISHFVAHCDSENIASYKIMEKIGMKLVCVNGNRRNRASQELRREFQYEM